MDEHALQKGDIVRSVTGKFYRFEGRSLPYGILALRCDDRGFPTRSKFYWLKHWTLHKSAARTAPERG